MLKWFSQVAAVTALNLRTIGERRGASLAAVFGVAGVVAVFVAVLSIAETLWTVSVANGASSSEAAGTTPLR